MSDSPLKSFFGYLLLAAGVLIVLLSGLCSAVVLISTLQSAVQAQQRFDQTLSLVGMILVFGGPPLALGIGLCAIGLKLVRGPRPPPSTGPF